MSPHVNDSASPAFRRLRATQFELCPSFLVGLDTGAYRAPGKIPIGPDIIHVSGGDAERDFEDDHLALPSSHCRPWTRLIYQ